jgi:flavin reductase (DIM6/NTAB) family NADH-FMN oxidoreductase RutF
MEAAAASQAPAAAQALSPAAAQAQQGQVSAVAYREFMSSFPTGVAVVTTVDPQGRALGFTCSSLCSVTLEPPTLLVCAANSSRTLAAILATGVFAVNLLNDRAEAAAAVLASGALDRLSRVRWEPSSIWRLPYLTWDAHGIAECELAGSSVVGSHTVLLGTVASVLTSDDVPLLRGFRRFASWRSAE